MKPERIDLDELGSCTRSAAYRVIAARYEFMVGQKLDELLQPAGPEKTAQIRGFIEGVKACQRIPEILRLEIEGRLKGRRANGKTHQQRA